MSDTISHWACPVCFADELGAGIGPRAVRHSFGCPGVPVERTYVLKGVERQEFIDALLSDEAVKAGSLHGHVTPRLTREIVRAAIAAVPEETT